MAELSTRVEAARLAELDRTEGWRAIMGTPSSRRVMWERFEVVGIYRIAHSLEPGPLAYSEGRRSVALQLMNDLLIYCPEQYDRMVTENRARLALEQTTADEEGDQ